MLQHQNANNVPRPSVAQGPYQMRPGQNSMRPRFPQGYSSQYSNRPGMPPHPGGRVLVRPSGVQGQPYPVPRGMTRGNLDLQQRRQLQRRMELQAQAQSQNRPRMPPHPLGRFPIGSTGARGQLRAVSPNLPSRIGQQHRRQPQHSMITGQYQQYLNRPRMPPHPAGRMPIRPPGAVQRPMHPTRHPALTYGNMGPNQLRQVQQSVGNLRQHQGHARQQLLRAAQARHPNQLQRFRYPQMGLPQVYNQRRNQGQQTGSPGMQRRHQTRPETQDRTRRRSAESPKRAPRDVQDQAGIRPPPAKNQMQKNPPDSPTKRRSRSRSPESRQEKTSKGHNHNQAPAVPERKKIAEQHAPADAKANKTNHASVPPEPDKKPLVAQSYPVITQYPGKLSRPSNDSMSRQSDSEPSQLSQKPLMLKQYIEDLSPCNTDNEEEGLQSNQSNEPHGSKVSVVVLNLPPNTMRFQDP